MPLLWSKRLKVSPDTFRFVVKSLCYRHVAKLPQLRKKLDKSAVEDAAQICSLVHSLVAEATAVSPPAAKKLEEKGFRLVLDNDPQFTMTLTCVIAEKKESFKCMDIPQVAEILNAVDAETARLVAPGSQQKVMQVATELETSEWELLYKKWNLILNNTNFGP